MKIAIHQPNFLPWLGYFYKMAMSDHFVFYDSAEYTKKSFIRRVKIHHPANYNLEKYLIVPLKRHSDFSSINELSFLEDEAWSRKIKSYIHQAYHKAPFYFQLEVILDNISCQHTEYNLSEYNIRLIQLVADTLDITKPYSLTSTMNITEKKARANIQICKNVGATKYISGYGAKKYQEDNQYQENGIQMEYSDFYNRWDKLNIPEDFKYKSIISHLACFPINFLKENLFNQ